MKPFKNNGKDTRIQTGRLKYVDQAKGWAIIFVLLIHRWAVPGISTLIGSFYMPFFFFLSGYVAKSRSGGGYRKYTARKAVKILKTYFFYSFILLVLYAAELFLEGNSLAQIPSIVIGIEYSRFYLYPAQSPENIQLLYMDNVCNAPLWFLCAYVCTIVIFYFTKWLVEEKKIRVWMVIGGLLFLTMGMYFIPILLPWSLDTACFFAMFMWLGKLAADRGVIGRWSGVFLKSGRKVPVIISVISLGVLVVISLWNGSPNISIRYYGEHGVISIVAFAVTSILGSLLFLMFCKMMENFRFSAFLETVGHNTLFLLGFHLLIYKWVDCILNALGWSPGYALSHLTDIGVIVVTIIMLTVLHEFYNERRKKEGRL